MKKQKRVRIRKSTLREIVDGLRADIGAQSVKIHNLEVDRAQREKGNALRDLINHNAIYGKFGVPAVQRELDPSRPSGVRYMDTVSAYPKSMTHDPVNHPHHYTSHPSGVECIQITEHMTLCAGNAVKYLWRAGLKGPEGFDRQLAAQGYADEVRKKEEHAKKIEDLKKARWYLDREISRLEKAP